MKSFYLGFLVQNRTQMKIIQEKMLYGTMIDGNCDTLRNSC